MNTRSTMRLGRGRRRDRARHRRARRLCGRRRRRRRRRSRRRRHPHVVAQRHLRTASRGLGGGRGRVRGRRNPGVKVEQTGYQNEDLQRTLIPNALSAGDPPDLFQVWPGGEIRDQVENGYLMPLDDAIADTISSVGATVNPWQVDGKTYAVPFTFGIEGFWYNTDLFEQAGIDAPPTTLDELKDAVGKLRDAGITPIAVGAGDKWPAAHWWYQFALHSCSPETLQAAAADFDFSDPCFVDAGKRARGLHRHQPVPGRLPRHSRPDRARAARRVSSPTARRPWSSWATGTPASIGGLTARREGARVPRLVPVPGDRGLRRRPGAPRSAAATDSAARRRLRRSAPTCSPTS